MIYSGRAFQKQNEQLKKVTVGKHGTTVVDLGRGVLVSLANPYQNTMLRKGLVMRLTPSPGQVFCRKLWNY